MTNINSDNLYTNLDKLYDEISTPSMKWEPVYQFYISKFSESYLKGNDIYIGPSLIKSDVNIFKKLKVMTKVELNNLEKKEKFDLKNHAGRNIGHISLTMK